ncbi:hypothetical protein [Ekhidna sp.]|uniref:hypothetical protein n=1 Tax=Ekhidna sp. TaxID=2608089 RepID=UPI003B50AA3B
MAELNNLDALAEQLFKEGISKSEKEAKKLLSDARAKSEELIGQAQVEAKAIISRAKKEAEKYRAVVDSQIHQKARQVVQDLKQQIERLISAKLLDEPIQSSMTDQAFVRQLILSTLEQWKEGREVELVISEQLMKEKNDLEHRIHRMLPGLTISVNPQDKDGFIIQHKEKGYILSFTDQAFKALFEPHLSKSINTIIFDSDA